MDSVRLIAKHENIDICSKLGIHCLTMIKKLLARQHSTKKSRIRDVLWSIVSLRYSETKTDKKLDITVRN